MYECSLERMTDKIKTMSQFGDALLHSDGSHDRLPY